MKKILRLSLIPKYETKNHAVLKVQNGALIMRMNDEDGYNFECGKCRTVLVEKASYGQVRNIVFLCNNCQSYNIVKMDWSVYVLKYLEEKIDLPVLIAGGFLTLLALASSLTLSTKVLVAVLTFGVSFFYKELLQVFGEK